MTATVLQLFRYPVKSMGGHNLTETTLTSRGVPGDRCWTCVDGERGGIKGGKRFPALMGMSARLVTEPDEQSRSPETIITFADGREFSSHDPQINDLLSAELGSPVSLWPIVPEDQLAHYARKAPDAEQDMEALLRETFARTEDEPLPDLSLFPAEVLQYESPPGTYFDAFPLLVMTTSSLRALTETNSASNFDVRRFRPNILLDMPGEGFPEHELVGREANLGSARLSFEMRCPRCVMTTHGFDDLPKDPKVMRTLVQQNGGDLGLYANIVTPGTIEIGDTLQLD